MNCYPLFRAEAGDFHPEPRSFGWRIYTETERARLEPQQGLSSTVIPDDRYVKTVLVASRRDCVCCHLPNIALFQVLAVVLFSIPSNRPYAMRGLLERLRARHWVAYAEEKEAFAVPPGRHA
jgi:hypothetical protein